MGEATPTKKGEPPMWTQKLAIIVSVAALTIACGEAPELSSQTDLAPTDVVDDENNLRAPDNVVCDETDLNGTYQANLIKRTGNCPDLEAFVIKMRDGVMSWGGPCNNESNDYSEELCRQDVRTICGDTDMVLTVDTELAQMEDTGSILTGSMTISINIVGDESANCNSEYLTKLERIY